MTPKKKIINIYIYIYQLLIKPDLTSPVLRVVVPAGAFLNPKNDTKQKHIAAFNKNSNVIDSNVGNSNVGNSNVGNSNVGNSNVGFTTHCKLRLSFLEKWLPPS